MNLFLADMLIGIHIPLHHGHSVRVGVLLCRLLQLRKGFGVDLTGCGLFVERFNLGEQFVGPRQRTIIEEYFERYASAFEQFHQ